MSSRPRPERRGRPLLAATIGLLLIVTVACQNPFARVSPAPSPHASPEANNSLAVADAALYSGRYDAAEADYQSLIDRGSSDARAHYALLLDYEGRFAEALDNARAAVRAAPTAGNLARLTRALDWSVQIPAAAEMGARAVAAGPGDSLAHSFYAEALSDSGRYTQAEQELARAATLAADPYTSSEVEREWSNYHRDRGDDQELPHVQASLNLDPGFPERPLELVRYYYESGHLDIAKAHQELDLISKTFGNSYAVNVEIADTIALSTDVDTANTYYAAALKLRPAAPAAALGTAQYLVSKKRDFNGAHDLLARSLAANPGSSAVYQYLYHLDLLLLKTDPGADLAKIVAAAPPGVAQAQARAYAAVNAYRASVGLPAMTVDAGLAGGSLAHCYYYLFNYGQKSLDGLGVHREDPALPGFTGASSIDRDRHAGYGGFRGSEVINHVFSPDAAVEVWFDSVYHRLPITDVDTRTMGYGEAQVGFLSIATMDFGVREPTSAGPTVYPYPGQTDVPGTFMGNEIPDPVPAGTVYPVGYPVTLQFGGADAVSLNSGRLLRSDGSEVPSFTLAPGSQDLGAGEWSLLAKQGLDPGAKYTVDLAGTLNGKAWSKRWSFTIARW